MHLRRILSLFMCFVALIAAPWSSRLHAQDSCEPVFDALTKVATTSNHSYSTHTMQGKTISGEGIYAQGKAFMRIHGKWMASPDSPKEILKEQTENRKNGAAACKIVRQESLDGQIATVYSLHNKTEDGTEDAQIWIAKSSGLPLREEMDMDVGGSMGKSHISIRYEYGNIQPPM